MKKIHRALISVYNKTGIVEFARSLVKFDVEIVSTGGTAKLLRESGIPVREVSDCTGFPEILGGRVKSLHPVIHGGILAERSNSDHMEQLKRHNIQPIDLLVSNLYPFPEVVSRPGASLEEAVENIDIGGPAMLRAAAKNFADVAVVMDPADYEKITRILREQNGRIDAATRRALAVKAFRHTSTYDEAIYQYLVEKDLDTGRLDTPLSSAQFPQHFSIAGTRCLDLRYGENPHQQAALYRDSKGGGIACARQIQGKELSFNNLLDLDAAFSLCLEFDRPAAVVVKHNNPCGAACDETLCSALSLARRTDPMSAFGGVIALNRAVDAATAAEIAGAFVEAVVAPGFEDEALQTLAKKKRLRLLQCAFEKTFTSGLLSFKQLSGGFLVQGSDAASLDIRAGQIATTREPTEEEWRSMAFAWIVTKHVRSNAIVLARANRTIGVGAGQMSRVDSAKIAVMKACEPPKGAACGSDAFFPFRDGLDTLAEAGVTAVVQPGGSKRDGEVIQAANEHGITMVFTGTRHFRH